MKTVEKLLKENNLAGALALLETNTAIKADAALNTSLIVIQGDFSQAKKDFMNGIIAYEEHTRGQNSLRLRIWMLNQEIETETQEASQSLPVVAACKAAYTLLVYLSETENGKTIFVERERKFYVRKPQAEAYFDRLPEMYIVEGHGKHLPKDIRKDLYLFRSFPYRILEHARSNGNDSELIEVTNPSILKLVRQTRHRLTQNLRAYM